MPSLAFFKNIKRKKLWKISGSWLATRRWFCAMVSGRKLTPNFWSLGILFLLQLETRLQRTVICWKVMTFMLMSLFLRANQERAEKLWSRLHRRDCLWLILITWFSWELHWHVARRWPWLCKQAWARNLETLPTWSQKSKKRKHLCKSKCACWVEMSPLQRFQSELWWWLLGFIPKLHFMTIFCLLWLWLFPWCQKVCRRPFQWRFLWAWSVCSSAMCWPRNSTQWKPWLQWTSSAPTRPAPSLAMNWWWQTSYVAMKNSRWMVKAMPSRAVFLLLVAKLSQLPICNCKSCCKSECFAMMLMWWKKMECARLPAIQPKAHCWWWPKSFKLIWIFFAGVWKKLMKIHFLQKECAWAWFSRIKKIQP